ncbi:MAG: hypothetical protein AAF757_02425 [Cyanobacteria bacterium P01_D01_bin.116]
MTKPKNKWRLILISITAIISFIVLLFGIFLAFIVWGFNRRKDVTYKDCGNETYELFRDFEGFWVMHNTKNEKMNEAGNDIVTRYDTLDITTALIISRKGERENIGFIPKNNKLEDEELNNLIECYPDNEMVLKTNIREVRVRPGFIEQQFDEEKLR